MTIITEPDYPPSSMMVAGAISGSSVEVVKELQRRVGDSSEIEVLPWARGYTMAVSQPNVALFATTRTPEREKLFHWVGPILANEWAFYAMKGRMAPLKSLEEARKLGAIGTYRDDAREEYLKSLGFTNLESVNNFTASAKMLEAGRVDVFTGSDIGLNETLQAAGVDPTRVEKVFTIKKVDLYIALSKGTDPKTVAAWQKAFADMKADGTFAVIYGKWYPGQTPPQ
jgi:polar amino acid transport system substrate-binding protein